MGSTKQSGTVYLIGAGPGEPKLLTLRGKECIECADTVVYDYLANEQLLNFAKKGAEIIFAGKRKGNVKMPQDHINQILVDRAREGKTVARLKGGDPFIFGRGGEEALALANAGIPFEIVPGVTSGVAVAAYAGIPLTHRDYATTVVFTSGHENPDKTKSSIPWEALSRQMGTLVFYMGITHLQEIVSNLTKFGRDPNTPIALIRWGTKPEQETVVGTLDDIVQKAQIKAMKPPATIVVGEVVRIREYLNWFENRPLFGKKVLVTRAKEQAGSLVECLTGQGAQPIEIPTIQTVPPPDFSGMDRALSEISCYDWIIFSSSNGVRYFFERFDRLGKDVRILGGIKIAAVGAKTAKALGSKGIKADLIPCEEAAEGLVEAFSEQDINGKRFLIPRALEAREILPKALEEMGGRVHVVEAYRTVLPEKGKMDLIRQLEEKTIDVATFTSASTVKNLVKWVHPRDPRSLLSGVVLACIGPITRQAVEEIGLSVHVLPERRDVEGLVEALVHYFQGGGTP